MCDYITTDTPFFVDPVLFSPVTINVTETKQISCHAEGNPAPTLRIEDSNNNVLTSSSEHVFYTFQSVTYDRAGDYKCIASNTIECIERSRVLTIEVSIQGRLEYADYLLYRQQSS